MITLLSGYAVVIDTWILAGQSNAEGYGFTRPPVVSGLEPSSTIADVGRSDLLVSNAGMAPWCFSQNYQLSETRIQLSEFCCSL